MAEPYRYKKQKKCKECSVLFNPSRPLQAYCSYRCSITATNRQKKVRAERPLICLVCKVTFVKRASDLKVYAGSLAKNRYRYCSTACYRAKIQTIRSLKIKAWGSFTKYIKERDNWTCFTCGKYDKSPQMHGGHFISRRYNATLFDEMNVHAQCAGCNMYRGGELHIYAERIISKYGQQAFFDLIERGKQVKKFTKQDLLSICERYKTMEKLLTD